MNYQKLDAALAMALNEVSNPETASLDVFVHTQPALHAKAVAILENLGVSDATNDKDVFTAQLSPSAIAKLTQEPWVQYLKLSQQLHLVNRMPSSRKLGI